ncbi:DUF3311 domain-containing protein [Heyndrickxia ginsengihumi]|uniref:DUF3311 domain-containing protein n=1 Tax=Heyndrickxia ginsengihumi TaxID=363870 RepID=A0A6M0P273_9BACI|nr:DUF3311 domain-containing protein [Heyndrickxia ginsengihumi]MBE6183302.1 DUF3311 domain-containing protein [Bacillus sp. (in: firmicutes)]MCM3022283.1 DUF3311 domain-containing protein [Heyndrickxia ginsengihumi]NEY18517.1 DUF3311 domain-containing protein [Heyndrickxia ginsengihumi]
MHPIKLLAFLPIILIAIGVIFFNRVTPFILGMPFLLFWLVACTVLSSVVMWIVFQFDPTRKEDASYE